MAQKKRQGSLNPFTAPYAQLRANTRKGSTRCTCSNAAAPNPPASLCMAASLAPRTARVVPLLRGRKCQSCAAPLSWTCASCGRLLSLSNELHGACCYSRMRPRRRSQLRTVIWREVNLQGVALRRESPVDIWRRDVLEVNLRPFARGVLIVWRGFSSEAGHSTEYHNCHEQVY